MPSCTDEQKRMAVDMVDECGGSVTRAMRKLGYHAPNAVSLAEPARCVAREKGRQAMEPLRPRAEGAGRGAREIGHGQQGRGGDAGGCRAPRWSTIGPEPQNPRAPRRRTGAP